MATLDGDDAADQEIHNYLIQLDTLRVECERRGDFARAQECVNRMREVNFRQARRLEALSKVVNADTRAALADSQRLELLTFTRVWEEKLAEFDQKASEAVIKLKESHMADYANQEGMLRLQLMNKRPRFSRTVVDLRDQLEKFVQLRRYLEAEELKRKLAEAEAAELAAFDAELSATFERKSQGLKKQYINELRAVEQKIRMGRDELECQRKADFERLIKSHSNAVKELDSETKTHIAKTRKVLERQVTVLTNDPVKTSVDFRAIRKQVGSVGGSVLSRSRTPTMTHSVTAGSAARRSVSVPRASLGGMSAESRVSTSHAGRDSISSARGDVSVRRGGDGWGDDSRFLW